VVTESQSLVPPFGVVLLAAAAEPPTAANKTVTAKQAPATHWAEIGMDLLMMLPD
jgi:hypothetical protein